jgi:Zn-dependent M28 family amino/carboxypeptidase
MKNYLPISLLCLLIASCAVKKPAPGIDEADVSRILNVLAADDMEGRATFTRGIEKAADFISSEFTAIGLQPYEKGAYRQTFHLTRMRPGTLEVSLDGQNIAADQMFVNTTAKGINWNSNPQVKTHFIAQGEELAARFRAINTAKEDAIVVVDPSFKQVFEMYRKNASRERTVQQTQIGGHSVVFVLGSTKPTAFKVHFQNQIEEAPLSNVIGVLPGKSKADEIVIFSAHYDHIGIQTPVGQDSIANGADDDASGVTAVLSLAKYYKSLNNNERTLLFVCFTGEEMGMLGSRYFSSQLEADKVVAMVNIEMIGKDSRFGENSMYVTGFDASNLAKLMQNNLKGTEFTFHPDPYPTQNLFYRSDNASLAEVGVPAHTFSTVQIEKDIHYHQVTDEVSTLNIKNIVSSIKAIATGAKGLVAGTDTPTRVEKLK